MVGTSCYVVKTSNSVVGITYCVVEKCFYAVRTTMSQEQVTCTRRRNAILCRDHEFLFRRN